MDASVFSFSVKEVTLSIVFVRDVNLWGRLLMNTKKNEET